MSKKRKNPRNKVSLQKRRIVARTNDPNIKASMKMLQNMNRMHRYFEQKMQTHGVTINVMAGLLEEQRHLFEQGVRQAEADRLLDCTPNCHWCCSLSVSVAIPEAFRIASYIVHDVSPYLLEPIRADVKKLAEQLKPDDSASWCKAQVMCPLCVGGLCLVYPVRPMTCASWNSYDVDTCRKAFLGADPEAHTPHNHTLRLYGSGVMESMTRALRSVGLKAHDVNLVHSLNILLTDEGQEQADAWFAGEDVFKMADVGNEY